MGGVDILELRKFKELEKFPNLIIPKISIFVPGGDFEIERISKLFFAPGRDFEIEGIWKL